MCLIIMCLINRTLIKLSTFLPLEFNIITIEKDNTLRYIHHYNLFILLHKTSVKHTATFTTWTSSVMSRISFIVNHSFYYFNYI